MIIEIINQQNKYNQVSLNKISQLAEKINQEIKQATWLCLPQEEEAYDVAYSLIFLDNLAIQQQNNQYRQIDQVTDVLSFPLLELKEGKIISPLQAADFLKQTGKKNQLPLGEICISLERAEEQAEEFNHSFEREVGFLILHGLLHLLGFDHMEEQDRQFMEQRQREILQKIDLTRDQLKKGEIMVENTDEKNREKYLIGQAEHVGFVAVIGRPNVGKSTLLNRIAGMKLAIVSSKPQTTRKNQQVIFNDKQSQIIFVDTPGIHKPTTELANYMVESSFKAASSADLILILVDGTKNTLSHVEEKVCQVASNAKIPVFLAINKVDAVTKEYILPLIEKFYKLYAFEAIIPVSARTGDGVEILMQTLAAKLPEGPRLFPEDLTTDQSERTLASELIREQLLYFLNQEIPHGTAVDIILFEEVLAEEAIDEYDRSLIKINASIICEKDSHKGIILGKNGQMIKKIGTRARENIEKLYGCKVFLDLHVKVRKDWKNKSAYLNDLGYKKGE